MCSEIVGRCSSAPELTYITRFGSSFNAGISTYGDTLSDTANMIYHSNSLSDLNVVIPDVTYCSIMYDTDSSPYPLGEKYDISDESEIITVS